MFSEGELMLISTWDRKRLYAFAKGKSVMAMLDFRRVVHKALAAYARHHKYDEVQQNVVRLMSKVEGWCRDAYFTNMRIRVLSEKPELASRPAAVKEIIKKSWENLVARKSY
jgi:hypothetical protein